MELEQIIVLIVSILLALPVGILLGYFIRVKLHEKSIAKSKELAQKIVEGGKK